MTARKLEWQNSGTTPIKVTRQEASTLEGFRRSAYAPHIKEILLKTLDTTRIQNETQAASEENRLLVAAVKSVVDVLFDGKVVLE